MNFYLFNQNNVGGGCIHDNKLGITNYVIIQARTYEQANTIALFKGLYFDGCSKGIDCTCCGDRWTRATSNSIVDLNEHLEHYSNVYVHYLNGDIFDVKNNCKLKSLTRLKNLPGEYI